MQQTAAEKRIARALSLAVQKPTVANGPSAPFLELHTVLRELFPLVFSAGEWETVQERALLGELEIDRAVYAIVLSAGTGGNDHPLDLNAVPFTRFSGYSGAGVELVALKATLYLVFADEAETLFSLAELIRREGESGGGRCVTAISVPHADFAEAPAA